MNKPRNPQGTTAVMRGPNCHQAICHPNPSPEHDQPQTLHGTSPSLNITSFLLYKGLSEGFGGQHKNNYFQLAARWDIYRKPLKQIQSSYVLPCTLFITFHLLLKAA